MEPIDELKMLIREAQAPYFDDVELWYQLDRAGGDVELAAYRCLIIKAENCQVQVSGLSIADTSKYWLRLAASVRPSGSRVVM
ncbi:MAG: hypothetical protein HFE39_09610 [Clostridiales bacterium]|jgi:hypothetical protein|nr:hypothetical protein [Clostridiales bacterium]